MEDTHCARPIGQALRYLTHTHKMSDPKIKRRRSSCSKTVVLLTKERDRRKEPTAKSPPTNAPSLASTLPRTAVPICSNADISVIPKSKACLVSADTYAQRH